MELKQKHLKSGLYDEGKEQQRPDNMHLTTLDEDLEKQARIANENVLSQDSRQENNEARLKTQAQLQSSIGDPNFLVSNASLRNQETSIVDFDLSGINRKVKMDDIRGQLKGMHIVKVDLDQDPFTGQHQGKAKLQMRIRQDQEAKVTNAMKDLGIRISNVSDKDHVQPKDPNI